MKELPNNSNVRHYSPIHYDRSSSSGFPGVHRFGRLHTTSSCYKLTKLFESQILEHDELRTPQWGPDWEPGLYHSSPSRFFSLLIRRLNSNESSLPVNCRRDVIGGGKVIGKLYMRLLSRLSGSMNKSFSSTTPSSSSPGDDTNDGGPDDGDEGSDGGSSAELVLGASPSG